MSTSHKPRGTASGQLLAGAGASLAFPDNFAVNSGAVLAGALPPERTGVYMGIFNFFIVLPEITASLFFGWVMNHLLHSNRMAAVIAGGVFLLAAAVLMQRVHDSLPEKQLAVTEFQPETAGRA